MAIRSRTHKTYSLSAPTRTHFRKATCQEVDCKHYREGWTYDVAMLDEPLIHAIRVSGRRWKEHELNGHTYWAFYPGQQCFKEHTVRLDREPFYFVTPNAKNLIIPAARQHKTGADWVDDFATHQEKIKKERGE
jgi:hypothetical protein